jgi:exocyst complex component 2
MWLDSQHDHIQAQMKALFASHAAQIEAIRHKAEPAAEVEGDGSERRRALNLQRCVLSLAVVKDPAAVLEGAGGVEVWRATHDLVKAASELLLKWLPNFWRVGKGFLNGKYKKVRIHRAREAARRNG